MFFLFSIYRNFIIHDFSVIPAPFYNDVNSGGNTLFKILKSETTSKLPERSFPILEMDSRLLSTKLEINRGDDPSQIRQVVYSIRIKHTTPRLSFRNRNSPPTIQNTARVLTLADEAFRHRSPIKNQFDGASIWGWIATSEYLLAKTKKNELLKV
jgi:hypothetical protein